MMGKHGLMVTVAPTSAETTFSQNETNIPTSHEFVLLGTRMSDAPSLAASVEVHIGAP